VESQAPRVSMVAAGTCPNCAQTIDRNRMKVSKRFACPQCGVLVRTSRWFRLLMTIVPVSLTAYVTWLSTVPLLFKFVEWPVLYFSLTCIYIWVFSILRSPTTKRSDDRAAPNWMVYDLVRQLPASLLTLAHLGVKAYSESFDLVHRREAMKPNAIWQVDHAQLGILLLKEDGTSSRPWLTVVIDDYSRAIAGYYLGFDPPSSLRTPLALRQGIWRKGHPHWHICGIPEVLYTDNGTDFTSKHLEQVAADLKIRIVFSIPGKPQGRGRIERFFRTVNEMLLCDLDGYTRRSRRKPSLTLGQFEDLFCTFLLEVYHRRASSEARLAPSERWEQGGFLPRMPESLEQLDLLLMHEVRARKVRRDGIHFQSLRYLSLTLAAYVGEDVTVRFDPRDMGEIRVFYKDRFL
jgi:putative transposase